VCESVGQFTYLAGVLRPLRRMRAVIIDDFGIDYFRVDRGGVGRFLIRRDGAATRRTRRGPDRSSSADRSCEGLICAPPDARGRPVRGAVCALLVAQNPGTDPRTEPVKESGRVGRRTGLSTGLSSPVRRLSNLSPSDRTLVAAISAACNDFVVVSPAVAHQAALGALGPQHEFEAVKSFPDSLLRYRP
jgi:hypothetical protein